MIKRDELANPESCINRAADDEPVFVLRARDINAPLTVRKWACEYIKRKELYGGELTLREHAKYLEARALATKMEDWQKTHGIGYDVR